MTLEDKSPLKPPRWFIEVDDYYMNIDTGFIRSFCAIGDKVSLLTEDGDKTIDCDLKTIIQKINEAQELL